MTGTPSASPSCSETPYRDRRTGARSVSESTSSFARTAASGTAMTDRQSLHVQHVNLRIHVPCSKTPDATRAFEPHSGQALCSFMPQASASQPSSVELTGIELDHRHADLRRTGRYAQLRGFPIVLSVHASLGHGRGGM